MKDRLILVIASLLSILFMSFHHADDKRDERPSEEERSAGVADIANNECHETRPELTT